VCQILMGLFFWWFLVDALQAGVGTVGPFGDQAQCEQMRAGLANLYKAGRWVSPCWWDGTS